MSGNNQSPKKPESPANQTTAAPSIEDRLTALEQANIELEKRIRKHDLARGWY